MTRPLPLVIIGCGGMGREVHDVVEALTSGATPYRLVGYLDDGPRASDVARVEARGARVLGGVDELARLPADTGYVIGIGSGSARRAVAARIAAGGGASRPSPVLVHPTASVGTLVTLGPGCVLCPGARVTTNVRVGAHVIVNNNATIAHDCRVDAYVTVNPAGTVSGGCRLGEAATIGAGAVVLQDLEVGAGSTVGAAACVVRDVARDVVVKGVPAR